MLLSPTLAQATDVQNVAVKVVVTPVLMGGASLAGRRWGHQIGGWLVALPLTSGPVAFFLATDHGTHFAASAAVGMLAGTASQVAVALTYRRLAAHGWVQALGAGGVAFAGATSILAGLSWSALPTFALVCGALAAGVALTRRSRPGAMAADVPLKTAQWDVPLRMVVATLVVLAVTALAPIIGPRLSGLLSPFPVFGVLLAVFTHRSCGADSAAAVLEGLLLGLLAPAVFFLVLAVLLPPLGLSAFLVSTVAALAIQTGTMFAIPPKAP